MKAIIKSFLFALLLVASVACSGNNATPATTPDRGETRNEPSGEPIRIALLPITDSVPFYVAEAEGYFDEAGVSVELVPVSSAPDRDILFQSGEAEGMLTDLVSTVVVNAGDGPDLVIVRQMRSAFDDEPMFFLVSGPDSGISTVEELAGQEIGISENSIIQYYTERLLTREGLTLDQIAVTGVPQLPIRLQLLMEGQLPAAVLPDPLASLAVLQGATIVASDAAHPEISQSVLAFGSETIANRHDEVAAIVQGWDRAVAAINADPAAYQDVLIANTNVPEPLQAQYSLPRFPEQALPSAAQIDDVNAWAMEKGLIETAQRADALVDPQFTKP
ncbi:MAG: ABC transporter substrate-binding protein [Anaerolineales bacterium]|nr:ABC transporter substrate-binding protein [Anaerolineales bacterium]MCB9127341.1 ABC transporter substrate-binding protein [Ardenticatenales bacterium]